MNSSPLQAASRASRLAWLVLFAAALLAPLLVGFDRYLLHVGITICFNVALVASLWLIWTLGVISFAHAGFMGIGAYTSALLLTKLGFSLWYGIWLSALLCGLIAVCIGMPLMRTRAVYFFMASWAVGEVIKRTFAYFQDFFGGWNGVFNIKAPILDLGFLHIDFSNRAAYYYLVLCAVSLCLWVIYRLSRSRTGLMYWAIHENELLASHVGINVARHKVICFAIACALVGVIGALYAHYETYISPKNFDIWKSEFALVHLIVGGLSTLGGPVAGAIVLTLADELLRATGYLRTLIFGVLLIASVLLLPGGLESLPGRLRKCLRRGKAND